MFEYKTYSELPEFEKKLAQFGDRVSIIAGLEINGKMSSEDAYQEIKRMYKELKQIRKGDG
jgi:hypothetical protein